MDVDGRLRNSVSLHLCHHAKKNLGFRIVVSEKSLVAEDSFLEFYRLSDQINNLQLMQRSFPSNHPVIRERPAPMESNNDVSVDADDL